MTNQKQNKNPAWDLVWFDWIVRRALWNQASGVAHGKLSEVGTSQFMVWLYVLSFIGYISLFVRTTALVIILLVTHQIGTLDYFDLTAYIAIYAALPILFYTLRAVGRRTWDITTRRVTGVMLLSILTCTVTFIAPFALYSTLPSYCTSVLETVPGNGQFQPSTQLTAADGCFSHAIKPLDPALMQSCATYLDKVGDSSYTYRAPVCQTGTTPPPRSASTPASAS